MSKLYVTEMEDLHAGAGYPMQVCVDLGSGATVDQTPVDFSGGVAPSAAFGAQTKFVRLHTDAICSIAFGKTPVATVGNRRMAAGQTEVWAVQPGTKVSAIANT